MFLVFVAISLLSCAFMTTFGSQADVVLFVAALPLVIVLYGLVRSRTLSDAAVCLHVTVLLLLSFANAVLIAFRYSTSGYPADETLGSLSLLCWAFVLGPTIGLACAYALTFRMVEGATTLLAPYIIICFAGSLPATMLYDVEADASEPEVSRARVLAKDVFVGVSRNGSHKIQITPGFDLKVNSSWITVGLPLWERAQTGQYICFSDFRGALGLEWRKIDVCPVT